MTTTLPGTTTYPGSTLYPGGSGSGPLPQADPFLRVAIDISGSPTGTPNWVSLTDSDLRAFTVSRGRENELSQFDAGTATLTVDNRDRAFDPNFTTSPYYPYIRPMTRFLLQVELNGVIYSLFKGYAESFEMTWPDWGGSDASCTINLVDEFKALVLIGMPVTDPPRGSYEEVVAYDNPVGFWRMNDKVDVTQTQQPSSINPNVDPPTDSEDAPGPIDIAAPRRSMPSAGRILKGIFPKK